MKEWKVRQAVFHRLSTDHDDELSKHSIEMSEDIVGNAVKYFRTTELGWVYPAKSYVVAICYAKWLSEEFNEDFYQLLDDPELLYGNDPYFVPYSKDKATYDFIIGIVGLDFDESAGIVPDVRSYYLREFMYETGY